MRAPVAMSVGLLCAVALSVSACSEDPVDVSGDDTSNAAAQEQDKALHDQLPAKIKKKGTIVSVQAGQFPPYHYVTSDGENAGVSIELGKALGDVLGVKFKTVTVKSLPGVLSGIGSGRYDMSLGPIGDFADREKTVDFVDWVQEYVAFAVPKGNPDDIGGLADICGNKIAVQAGGSAEEVARKQSKKCQADGEPAAKVQSFQDQNAAVLAVRSGRSDAFFSSQAPLTYFSQQSPDKLQVAAGGQSNGFDDLRQGAVVPKDSELADILLKAFQKLYENGTYQKLMKDAGLKTELLPEPGINLGHEL